MKTEVVLTNRGFKKEGHWTWTEGSKEFNPNCPQIKGKNYYIYAFVIKDEVRYIGSSADPKKNRIYNIWAKPHLRSKVMARLKLNKAISDGEKIDIWFHFIPDPTDFDDKNKSLSIKEYTKVIKEGSIRTLEKKLIQEFTKMEQCDWNTTEKK
jgi:hypothetical protein